MNVILSAFACQPQRGSEPGVGWGVACEVATRHKVWVLTCPNNRPLIEGTSHCTDMPDLQFVYVRIPSLIRLVCGPSRLGRIYYFFWQIAAYFAARRLMNETRFDLVHHVTFVNPWLPSWLGWLGVPFIWSAGCCDRVAWSLLASLPWKSRMTEAVRNVALGALLPLTRTITGRRAKAVLSSSSRAQWPPSIKVNEFPLGGLSAAEFDALATIPQKRAGPLRIGSAGRLLGWKGCGFSLEAFSLLLEFDPQAEYWIIGEGPERAPLKGVTRRLGIQRSVRFLGWLEREALFSAYEAIDVFVHPSLHEAFGFVVLEAMAAARPVICLDVGGPSQVITPDCGILVPLGDRASMVLGLYQALLSLAENEPERLRMGLQARAAARQRWIWPEVGRRLLELYDGTLNAGSAPATITR